MPKFLVIQNTLRKGRYAQIFSNSKHFVEGPLCQIFVSKYFVEGPLCPNLSNPKHFLE